MQLAMLCVCVTLSLFLRHSLSRCAASSVSTSLVLIFRLLVLLFACLSVLVLLQARRMACWPVAPPAMQSSTWMCCLHTLGQSTACASAPSCRKHW